MKISELLDSFNAIVLKYTKKLCEQLGFKDEPNWINDEIGGVLEICDYFLDFSDVRYIVDNDIDFDEFYEWYDYVTTLKMINYGICTPTLKSWHEGCPRKTKSDIEKLKQLKKNVEEAEEILRIEIEKQKNN